MRIYCGTIENGDCIVTVEGQPLDLRLDLVAHSPTGFQWGYAGSGPAQLACALLADALDDDDWAIELHQRFKFEVVATLKGHIGWKLTQDYIMDWACSQLGHERPKQIS